MLKIFKNKTEPDKQGTKQDAGAAVMQKVDRVEKEKSENKSAKSSRLSGSLRYLIFPLTTEKTTVLKSSNKYSFKVADRANKEEIKKAIRAMYGAKVADVNIVNIHPKQRRSGRNIGFKSGYKKAIITLVKGEKIEEI